MKTFSPKTSKSFLIFKRTCILLSMLLCSLMVSAKGDKWKAYYDVSIDPSGCTGSGVVYIQANCSVNSVEADKFTPTNDVKNQIDVSYGTNVLTLSLSKECEVDGKDGETNLEKLFNTAVKYENIKLSATANPGSIFEGWEPALPSGGVIKGSQEIKANKEGSGWDTSAEDAHVSHTTPYKPIFTARTYYYQIPGAEATNGGKVYRSDATIDDITTITGWQDKFPRGNANPVPSQKADENGKNPYATTPAKYFYAQSPGDDYVFAGWYDSNTKVRVSADLALTYSLVAKSEDETKPTTVTLIAHFVPKAVDEITPDNKVETGIYSGTEGNNNTYPYKEKWQVNLSYTFDESGSTLFDRLYIFGETKTLDGDLYPETTEKTSNAITPCYIYEPNTDKNKYVLCHTIGNMNVSTKDSYFNVEINAENTGMKLYLTGWCPYATTGYTTSEHGVLHVYGNEGRSVDVYMEECYLYSRVHLDAQSAAKPYTWAGSYEMFEYALIGGGASAAGAASALVFECSYNASANNVFYPKVHIKGSNLVFGHRGCPGTVFGKVMGQYCAPIFLRPANSHVNDVTTELTLDDKWPTSASDASLFTHTNGYLKFEKNWEAGPSIDLGNENGVVNFNGGRYELAASQPKQVDYTNNLAICYRTGIVTFADFKVGNNAGMAGDGAEGTVNINDGSVYVTQFKTKVYNNDGDLIDNSGYFEDIENIAGEPYSQTLRLPANSYVRGGSHKGYIRACADLLSSGTLPSDGFYTLEQREYAVPDDMINGSFVKGDFFLTNDGQSGLYTTEQIISEKSPDLNGKTLKQYYEDNTDIYELTGGSYGRASIAPEEKDGIKYVYLWVPGDAKRPVSYVQWQVFTPSISAEQSGISANVGGDDKVVYEVYDAVGEAEPEPKTILQNLLYAHLNDDMMTILRTSQMPIVLPGGDDYIFMNLEMGSKNYANITTENAYKINKSIYYAMLAAADEWITFCPPFDVSKIYVLETCDEATINAYVNSTALTRDEALSLQAQCNADCASLFALQLTPGSHSTIWDIYDKSYKSYVNYVKDPNNTSIPNNRKEIYASYSTSSAQMPRTELVHLYKTNAPEGQPQYNYADAHYYLYQIGEEGITLKEAENDAAETYMKIDWELAPATTNASDGTPCIMKKEQVYAMQFPYCPGCDKDEAGNPVERTYWDYWTGKFIVFEGVGPQTIAGTSAHAGIMANNVLGLYGNYTFSELNFASPYNWENKFINSNGQFVVSIGGEVLTTGQSFLYVPTPSSLPGRIKSINAETGAITWEEGDDDNQGTTTGTPTISGNRQMMVYTIEGGVGIIPVIAQQVSIYNAAGQLVTSQYLTAETTVSLPAGIYLISGEKEQAKVIVK